VPQAAKISASNITSALNGDQVRGGDAGTRFNCMIVLLELWFVPFVRPLAQ
jgi:hypothetical protein